MLEPCYNCQKYNKYFLNLTFHIYVLYKCLTSVDYVCPTQTCHLRDVSEPYYQPNKCKEQKCYLNIVKVPNCRIFFLPNIQNNMLCAVFGGIDNTKL